ncbi:MAG: MurR/RpiR family transcriptional regulator, partial [Gammaproteobacteria bacterium]|nr:MurR/RpiR family transcriptional regulator [Gammaproteobacteria bacterium]
MTFDTTTNEAHSDAPRTSFESRIREQYDALPASERKIADLILEFPGDVAAYSATELAALANSSKAAITRLIRR